MKDKQGKRIEGYKFNNVNTRYGWIGDSGSRRARELAESGDIQRARGKKGYAEYWI